VVAGVEEQHIDAGAHLRGQVDQDAVLHVRRDDVIAAEVLVGPAQQVVGVGTLEFRRAAFGQRDQVNLVQNVCHRKSASSARTAHVAKRSPSSRCFTKLRTTRSM
jgi:hypothetical protein